MAKRKEADNPIASTPKPKAAAPSPFLEAVRMAGKLNYTIPSQRLIEQLNKLSSSIITVDFSEYSKLATSISTLKLPDMSKYELDFFSKISSGELQKAADTYNSNLRLIQQHKSPNPELTAKVEEMADAVKQIESALNSQFLKGRIHPDAYLHLNDLKSGLSQGFLEPEEKETAVLSVDIRRSTELMLKAKDPMSFAVFITEVTNTLKAIITSNNGIFDKFTGDGILAYFPTFYSGPNPMGNAIVAATECHAAFDKIYKASRSLFSTVLVDTGLGVGIDFGGVNIVTVNDEITVVGRPVVYACRLSSAPAGTTLVNQGAYDQALSEGIPVSFEDVNINIKHEGEICVKRLVAVSQISPSIPEWRSGAKT